MEIFQRPTSSIHTSILAHYQLPLAPPPPELPPPNESLELLELEEESLEELLESELDEELLQEAPAALPDADFSFRIFKMT